MNILEIALSQYGVTEKPGRDHEETIIKYAHEAGHKWVNDDETAWCSIFMDWCAMQANVERTRRANARSWLSVGDPVQDPKVGDIVVFKRGSSKWQGHVGIFISEQGNYINVLGGNQSNQVRISKYRAIDLLGFRRLNPENEK